ncbi:HET-domain-containing protein [Whalleya microplaca]|nr:HET-domain-containing protein [Whalleya microplaca]
MCDLYDRQLNNKEREVRILELYEPVHDRAKYQFKCRLRHDTLNKSPSYAALSYHWGDMIYQQDLMVDSRVVRVSSNLLAALEQLWKMKQRLIWVDFLCINQSNNEEKSGQVKMMDTIFAKAQWVFAWLGPEANGSDLAMEMLGAPQASSQQWEWPVEVETACDAIIRLFSRPYFERMWIIQEICRAQDLMVVCGQHAVAWKILSKRLDLLGNSVPAQYARHLISQLRWMRRRIQHRDEADADTRLIPLIILSRKALAKDPRDKLYALLALAEDGRAIIPTPNYLDPVEKVFQDTARGMIEKNDRTDVILLAHRSRGQRNLPSWVPDWANLTSRPPLWVEESLVKKRPIMKAQNIVHGDVLEVRGYRHDVIVDFLDLDGFDVKPAKKDPHSENLKWQSIVVNLCMGLTTGTTTDCGIQDVVQVMYELCRDSDDIEDAVKTHFSTWILHNRRRMVGLRTIQQHLEKHVRMIGPSSRRDKESRKGARQTLEEGFERLERLRMKFAVTKDGSLRVVYRAAEKNDHIYILENCPLPVVLRPSNRDRFRFIGEVFVSEHFKSTRYKSESKYISIE